MARQAQTAKTRPICGGLVSKDKQPTTMAASKLQTPEKGGCSGNARKTGFEPMGDAVLSLVQCGWYLLCQIREEWKNEGNETILEILGSG